MAFCLHELKQLVYSKDDVSHFMSMRFSEFPFWKNDLINLDSSLSFKGNSVFSLKLNFLTLCKERMFKTFKQSAQFSANEECLAQWDVIYL